MLLGDGLFAAEGTHWEKFCAALKPGLARNQAMAQNYRVRHTQCLIDRISRNGEEVDLQVLFFDMVGAAFPKMDGSVTNGVTIGYGRDDGDAVWSDWEDIRGYCIDTILWGL